MSKKFKTIYLHIGLMKTGTSKIQEEIYANRSALERKNNLLYPSIEFDPRPFKSNHSIFIGSLFSNTPWNLAVNMNNGLDKKRIKQLNDKIYLSLSKKFAETRAEDLLISAETISYFNEEEMEKVLDWFRSMSDDIRIICCLRHPLDALSSTCQQIVKTGRSLRNFLPTIDASYIRKTLTRIGLHVNKSQIKLYDFSVAKAHPKGLLGKFFDEIGIPLDAISIDSTIKVNSSMSMEATILYSCLNHHLPKFINNKLQKNRLRRDLQFFNKNFKGQKFRTPGYVYQRLKEEYNKIDKDWLFTNYSLKLRDPIKSPLPIQLNDETIMKLSEITNFSPNWIRDQLIKEIDVLNNQLSVKESELDKVALAVNSFLLQKMENRKN